MKERKRNYSVKKIISYVLAAAMVTTSIPGTLLASAEELSEEYVAASTEYVEEIQPAEEYTVPEPGTGAVGDALSDGAEEITNGTALIADTNIGMTEETGSTGTDDLLSDGVSDTGNVGYAPIELEKVLESGLTVKVTVPEEVFPEGTVVDAADVNEEKLESLTGKIKEDLDNQLEGEIINVIAVDISFLSKEGISLLPGTDVDVTLVPGEEVKAELKEKEEKGLALSLVYIPEEGSAAVVADDKIVEKSVDGISFKTVQFPRYAIVATADFEEAADEAEDNPAAEQDESAVEEADDEESKADTADEELTAGEEDLVETVEQVDSAKVEGVRKSYYMYFTAELSGATVVASVPYYYVGSGTTMEASYAAGDEYEPVISRANYGKALTDLKAVEVRFADKRGRETFLINVNLSIQLDDTGAEKYVLYQPYRGWFGTELYQLRTSRSPKFSLYSYTDTYVIAGLKDDGVDRAAGVTRRGRTSFGLSTGNADITVDAEKNTFSESVSMEAVPADAEAVVDAVNNVLGEDKFAESIQAFDISFHNTDDGEEVEPKKDVAVTIAMPLDEETEYTLVHVKDDGEAEVVENAVFSTGGVTFRTGEFSVYAIVGEGTTQTPARITYKFCNEDGTPYIFKNKTGQEVDNQILKDGEVLEDVGLPEGTNENSRFLGWYDEDGNLVPTDEAKTVTETNTVILTATFETLYNVSFMTAEDSTGTRAVKQVKQVTYITGQSTPLTVAIDDVTTEAPTDTQAFIGWNTVENATTALESPVEISGDTVFYPVFSEASWLYFDENDGGNEGGASYTPPQFVLAGGVTVRPDDPHRKGYRFDGWYKEPECRNAFTFGTTLSQPRTTVYAKWTALEAKYTIIIRKQRVTDSVDAADSEKTYDYEASVSFEGTIGDTVTIPSVYTGYDNQSEVRIGTDSETHSFIGFHYNAAKTTSDNAGKTIAADGSTVIDVFYDRNIISISFDYPSSSSQTQTVTIYEPAENGQYYYYNDPYDTGYYEGGTGPTPNARLTHHRGLIFEWTTFQVFGLPRHTHYHYDTKTGYYRVGQGPDPTAPGTYNLITQTVSGTEYPADTTWRGLFGATFDETGYTWPSTYEVKYYNNSNVTINTVNTLWEEVVEDGFDATILVFLDAFILPDPTQTDYYLRPHSTGNVPVRFYQQNVDGSYPNTAAYEVTSSGGRFMITDKYTGFKAAWYRTQSNSGWSSWSGLTTPNSEGIYYTVPQGYAALEIRFERLEYDLEFRNGIKGTPGETVSMEKVKYQAPLNTVETPSVSYPESSDADHYEFTGWYADPEFTTYVSFEDLTEEQIETIRSETGASAVITYKTMPANNLVLYAGWRIKGYDCALNPNGGKLREGDSYQAGVFWLQYGSTISDAIKMDTTREGYELVGWMVSTVDGELLDVERDPERGNLRFVGDFSNWTMTETPWNFDTEITGPVYLTAKWRSVSALSVVYDAKEGSGAPDDDNKYVDGTPAVVLGPATPPENKLFAGWHIVGSPETEIYTPGYTFTVDSQYAADGVITLEAVYTDVNNEDVEVTHITWYANGGIAEDGTTTSYTDDALQINKGIPIMPADTFTRDGYIFLGWARVPTTDNSGNPLDGYTLEPKELSAEDLYLRYEDGVYKTPVDGTWTAVTKVAADEQYPYHDMYAVWGTVFYVYHSGTEGGAIDKVYMYKAPEDSDASLAYQYVEADGTYDLTQHMTSGTLYGGYYLEGGFTAAGVNAEAEGLEEKYESVPAYDGSTSTWTWTSPQMSAKGTAITPVMNTVYFVKEVPASKYLKPYMHYTYGLAEYDLVDFWLVTDVDDKFYREVGFIITTADDKTGKLAKSLTIRNEVGDATTKITAADQFGGYGAVEGNLIAWVKDSSLIKENETYTVVEYWKTPDQVVVTGSTQRTISMNGAVHQNYSGKIKIAHEETEIPVTLK